MLQAVVRNNEVGTVRDQHGRAATPIGVHDDRATGPHGDQHRLVADHRGIAASVDAHRGTRLAAPVAATHDAWRKTALGK